MEHNLTNDKLTIFLKGELNSYNSEEVEEEIEELIKNNSFNAIVLDMKALDYISSAGIRIIVRLKQQYDDTSLVNVPSSINDIFEMVGLNKMIKIEKIK